MQRLARLLGPGHPFGAAQARAERLSGAHALRSCAMRSAAWCRRRTPSGSPLGLAAMIDGLWLRATLSSPQESDSRTAREIASAFVDGEIARAAEASATRAQRGAPSQRDRASSGTISAAPMSTRRRRETFATINPATGETLAVVEIAGRRGGGARRRGRAARPARCGRAMTGAERAPRPAPRRRYPPRTQRRPRAARDARHRQADPGDLAVDVISGAECFEYFAGQRGGAGRRACRSRSVRLRLHAARAARHRRRHRRLELPAPDRLLERRRRRSPAAMR